MKKLMLILFRAKRGHEVLPYVPFPIAAAALLCLAACATPSGAPNLQGKPLSGYVEMSQVQAAYISSGSAGHGTLRFRGTLILLTSADLVLEGSASRRSRQEAMSTGSGALATFQARTLRAVMASPWALRARGTYGCRTNMASLCV